MTELDQKAFDTVKRLFKNDYGEPFEMALGQIAIFRAIYEKQSSRVQVESYTQYGKSDIISMAVLLRATTFPEKWPIVGGTKEKAKIIMGYVIKHLFENNYTLGKFMIEKGESVERIKRERSKERLTFRVDEAGNMGEVFLLSAEARRRGEDAGNILIGYGAPNLILDDAPLTPDNIYGKALRMLGGHIENFLLKIGNTFNRNHFLRSHNNPKFKKIVIDYHQGIREGRVTPEYIEEMREELDEVMFGILYECKFPGVGMIEAGEWIPLITEIDIEEAQKRKVESKGYAKLGADYGEGGSYNAFIIRTDNYAYVKSKDLESDLMKTAKKTLDICKEERVLRENAFGDAIGIGAGIVSRLNELGFGINPVKSGEKPTEKTDEEKKLDPIEFYNLRAEMYWKLRKWIREGGALEPHRDWKQLCQLRYKEDAGKRIKIMSKEEMKLRGIFNLGLDTADGLALTFAKSKEIRIYHTKATEGLKPYYPEIGL